MAAREEQDRVSQRSSPPRIRRNPFFVAAVVVVALVALFVSCRSVVADWSAVRGPAMTPSILAGDLILVNKAAYSLRFPLSRWHLVTWKEPVWGDLVVFRSPEDGKPLLKRIVGLPGDTIEIRNNQIIRSGEPATYEALADEAASSLDLQANVALYSEEVAGRRHSIMVLGSGMHPPGPFYVPEGKFFVMGDNRNNSRDSRYFGPVNRASILGQATAVLWSFDPDYSRLRSGRFFIRLQ